MQRAVLLNQSTAIYPDNFITGKSLPQHFPRAGIILRLAIGGVKHCIIQNQEISVSGRKPFPFLFYLIGHGQSQQTVRFPLQRTESLQLLLHAMQFFVMLIIRILALYIGYRVGRAETGQRVYMTVRIVTCQITVVQPKNTLQVKTERRYSSISTRFICPFRLGESRHSEVVSNVPMPSLSMEPPSRTNPKRFTYFPFITSDSTARRVIKLSLSDANFNPHPLNLKSSRDTPSASSRVMAPWSRAQVSFVSHFRKRTFPYSPCRESVSSPHPVLGLQSAMSPGRLFRGQWLQNIPALRPTYRSSLYPHGAM